MHRERVRVEGFADDERFSFSLGLNVQQHPYCLSHTVAGRRISERLAGQRLRSTMAPRQSSDAIGFQRIAHECTQLHELAKIGRLDEIIRCPQHRAPLPVRRIV